MMENGNKTFRGRWERFEPKTAGLVLLCMAAVLFLASLPGRAIHVDDNWFAEQAYWLAQDGIVRSEMFAGLLGYEQQQFVYHKFHIWQDALALKLFGLSVYAVKAIPLIYFLAFLGLAYFYCRRYLAEWFPAVYLIMTGFLLVDALLVEHAFVNRPELVLMFFGFVSFVGLQHGLTSGRQRWMVVSGVAAGLAALTHLNGLAFMLAGASLLGLRRQYVAAAVFSFAAVAAFSLYFVDILAAGGWERFLYQFRNDPALASADFSLVDKILKVFDEHKRFFRHPKEIAFSLFFLTVFWLGRDRLRTEPKLRFMGTYLFLLVLFVAVLSPGQKDYYLLYYTPYIAILVGALLPAILEQGGAQRRWVLGLALLYVVVNFAHTILVMGKTSTTPAFNAAVAERFGIEKGARIIAPLSFVFDELPNYRIKSDGVYLLKARKQWVEPSVQGFFSEAAEERRSFVITEPSVLKRLGLPNPQPNRDYYGYRYLDRAGPYLVFMRDVDAASRSVKAGMSKAHPGS